MTKVTPQELEALAAEILGDAAMTAPSIREALKGLVEAVRRDADEGGKGISGYTSARLSDARAALATPPQDVVKEIAKLVEPGAFHDDPIDRQKYCSPRRVEAVQAEAREKATAILASGLVTAGQPSRKITMSDVRLIAGEGKLSAHDVLAAVNAHLRIHPMHPDEAAIRADERERCARVADDDAGFREGTSAAEAGHRIAAAIRAGGTK